MTSGFPSSDSKKNKKSSHDLEETLTQRHPEKRSCLQMKVGIKSFQSSKQTIQCGIQKRFQEVFKGVEVCRDEFGRLFMFRFKTALLFVISHQPSFKRNLHLHKMTKKAKKETKNCEFN